MGSLRSMVSVRGAVAVVLAVVVGYVFVAPGVALVRDLSDPALGAPGVPRRARVLHRDLTPRFEAWARERVASGRAAEAALHDVPTTEWPMFSAVFYLMATQTLEANPG